MAYCLEGITGKVVEVRWLLGAEKRAGKTASSVVVYLDKEVFVGGSKNYIGGEKVLHGPVPMEGLIPIFCVERERVGWDVVYT